jgi:hypothetical protein
MPVVSEYWPYGLRRAGALERFHALVAERYSIVVDLRDPTVALDATRVADLADRYTADQVDPYTDLLLLSAVRSEADTTSPATPGIAAGRLEHRRRRPRSKDSRSRRQKTGVSE